jgi:DNA-binding response OmpR family regulator
MEMIVYLRNSRIAKGGSPPFLNEFQITRTYTKLTLRVLLVEDDEVISERLKRALEKEGYPTDLAHDGQVGLDMARMGEYSVIILDVMMPKRDGWSVCQALRDSKNTTPILMLTAKDAIEDRVKGLDLGADDYLVKPFSLKEFLARIRALTRRNKLEKSSIIHLGELDIDAKAMTVTRSGEPLKLTKREFTLLEALARNRRRILSREYIIEQIWNDEDSVSNTVNFHVTSLRKKIDAGREKSLIETVHGFGYRITEDV